MKTMTRYITTVLILLVASGMYAKASINANYGDFAANTVSYNNVSEFNTVATGGEYGAPIVTGDTLSFAPLGMKAEATGGSFVQNDYQVQFEIQADTDKFIQGLDFAEAGDISMYGTGGTDATGVDVSASFFVTIYEVDGVELDQTITKTFGFNSMTFSSPSTSGTDGTVLYVSDLGGAGTFFSPAQTVWDGSIYIDLNDILDEEFTSYTSGVTRVSFNIDNVLLAASETDTTAFITKKQAGGFSVTSDVVPEPASAVLLVGTASLLGVIRRRFII